MKLLIQIPCFNEENTLPQTLANLPKKISGIDVIETQIIDDGCTDRTVELAKKFGVNHIVSIKGKNRRWLGRAFRAGIDNALKCGADIVVNTDGDNQYPGDKIKDLVTPILDGRAQLVIGNRDPGHYGEFSYIKKFLQSLGNHLISFLTAKHSLDAVSGFRAYSRDALLQLNIITNYTYTVDTLMQAYKKGIDVEWISITPNPKTRESRLIKNLFSKVRRSGATILRMSTVYTPFKTFGLFALLFGVPGIALLIRFLYFYIFIPKSAAGHIQSVMIGGVLVVIAIQMFALGVIGDLLAVNRALLEETLSRTRKRELERDN